MPTLQCAVISSISILIILSIIILFYDSHIGNHTIYNHQATYNQVTNGHSTMHHHRILLSSPDATNEPITEDQIALEEDDLCIVCFDKRKNDDALYIAWTPEEWKEMSSKGLQMHFPDCHGSELCSGCLIKIVCDANGECPACKRKPQYPSPLKSNQASLNESSTSSIDSTESQRPARSRSSIPSRQRVNGYSRIAVSSSSGSSVSSIRTSTSRSSGHISSSRTNRGFSRNVRPSSRTIRQRRTASRSKFMTCWQRASNKNSNSSMLSWLLPCFFGSKSS